MEKILKIALLGLWLVFSARSLLHAEVETEKLYQRGLELMQTGKYRTAAMYFMESAPRKSNYVEPYYQAGLCYFKLGELGKARANLFMAKRMVIDEKLRADIEVALTQLELVVQQETTKMQKVIDAQIEGMNSEKSRTEGAGLSTNERKELQKKFQAEYEEKVRLAKPKVPDEYSYGFGIVEIRVKRLNFAIGKEKKVDYPEGALVTKIYPPLPVTDPNFIRENDIIKAVGDRQIIDLDDFMNKGTLQEFADLPGIRLVRDGQELPIRPTDELKTFLNALDALQKGKVFEALDWLHMGTNKESNYKNINRTYTILIEMPCIDKSLDDLVVAKNDIEKSYNPKSDLEKLTNLSSETSVLKPYRDMEKTFRDFIVGLNHFPTLPTYLDYDKYSKDINSFSGKIVLWRQYLESIRAEMINLCESADEQLYRRKNFTKSQYAFLVEFNAFLNKMDEWGFCRDQAFIPENIILVDDSFSNELRGLSFLKSSEKMNNLYLIDKQLFQNWLRASISGMAEESKELYTSAQLREVSERLLQISSDIRGSQNVEKLKKTILEMNVPFTEMPMPEELRQVNESFKTANALVKNLKRDKYATSREQMSYEAMLNTSDTLDLEFGRVFSLILDMCIEIPHRQFSKMADVLYTFTSENSDDIENVEKIEKELRNSRIYNEMSSSVVVGTREKITAPLPKNTKISPKDGSIMIFVPAGEFLMGAPEKEGDPDEHPEHKVYLGAYYIDKYEITVAQYRKFCQETGRQMPPAPSWGWRDNHPISCVTWDDANAYAKWADRRLPTEAEWEKACRGGATTTFHYGDSLSSYQANFDGGHPYGGASRGPYRNQTTPVGSFQPNTFGLYDMHGNVWEWCADRYNEHYSGISNPIGPNSGTSRVVRGGGWNNDAHYCRSANRLYVQPLNTNYNLGFRCVSSF